MDDYNMKRLINENLSFTEAMRIIKRNTKKEIDKTGLRKIRVAIISSGSVQYFTKIFQNMMIARGYECEIYESEYDGINMNILDLCSELYSFQPEYVIVLPYYTDIKEFPGVSASDEEYNTVLNKAVMHQMKIFDNLSTINGVHVFYGNYAIPYLCEMGSYECNTRNSKNNFLMEINRKMVEEKPKCVTILDLDACASYVGKSKWFDLTGYFCNKVPFALDYILPVTNQVGRLIDALSGHQKKCLVLDLDNTLWGGVVGDAGAMGVVLDPNNAEGESYRFFQSYIKALKERGVILAVCSKNDMEVATAPFKENPYMVLGLDDISCFIANWEDKAGNLRKIASELNIGVDSLVFFDDNPAEREIVRKYVPEVYVIDVPEDVDGYAVALDRSGVFDWVGITKEDIGRIQTYRANAERKKLEETAVDYDEYLKSLEMRGSVTFVTEDEVERFTQLINKSNQFNLRTMRYTEKQIQDMMSDEQYRLLSVKLSDKFSVYGIIACVILQFDLNVEHKSCFVDTLVMSCRVLKRGVEAMIINNIISVCQSLGIEQIKAEYIHTERNRMVAEFFDSFGFEKVEDDGEKKEYNAKINELKNNVHYIDERKL